MRFPTMVSRYNIAPSTPVLGARNANADEAEFMTWGPRLINARSETLATKPAFALALEHRRAIVFADGYYEWQAQSGVQKQPYYIKRASGEPFAFAALWEELPLPGEGPRYACTLVTQDAHEDVAWIHNRMPVILDQPGTVAWIYERALEPLQERLVAMPVSRAVNRPNRDNPSLIVPVTPPIQDSLF